MSEFEKKISEYKNKLKSSNELKQIESLNAEIFGKNGIINLEFKKIGSLSVDKKKVLAAKINNIKDDLLKSYNDKFNEISTKEVDEEI